MALTAPSISRCSIAQSLTVLGEKWTLLVVRDAFWGRSKFSEFKESLGISSDILTDRLQTLVDAGVLERHSYRDEGSRERFSYHLTASGKQLAPLLAAFVAWGDEHRPTGFGPASVYRESATGRPVTVGFVTEDGVAVDSSEVELIRGPGSLS